jgi:hypothetical protein
MQVRYLSSASFIKCGAPLDFGRNDLGPVQLIDADCGIHDKVSVVNKSKMVILVLPRFIAVC